MTFENDIAALFAFRHCQGFRIGSSKVRPFRTSYRHKAPVKSFDGLARKIVAVQSSMLVIESFLQRSEIFVK